MTNKKTRRELCAAAGADVRKLINENRDAVARELAEACQALLDAFVHVPGDARGNKSRTDALKYNPAMRAATWPAHCALDKARKAGLIL